MCRRIETEADLESGIDLLLRLDPKLQEVFRVAGRPPLRKRDGGFRGLSRIVVSQQLSVASASAIWKRVEDSFDPFHHDTVLAARAPQFKRAGLSRPKIKTFREGGARGARQASRSRRAARHARRGGACDAHPCEGHRAMDGEHLSSVFDRPCGRLGPQAISRCRRSGLPSSCVSAGHEADEQARERMETRARRCGLFVLGLLRSGETSRRRSCSACNDGIKIMPILNGPRIEPRSGKAKQACGVPARLRRRRQRSDLARQRVAIAAVRYRVRFAECTGAVRGRTDGPTVVHADDARDERALDRRAKGDTGPERVSRRGACAPFARARPSARWSASARAR